MPSPLIGLLPLAAGAGSKDLILASGLKIVRSANVWKQDYTIPSTGLEPSSAAIVIRGRNIVVDFQKATLRGSPASADPDRRTGVGILVEGDNITIKNATVRGYKIAIWARNTKNLRVVDSDLSYNWRPRLLSTREKEDLQDWLSFQQNDKNEWTRYGAAIYLEEALRPEVKGVRITGGQNGIMMTKTSGGTFWNNEVSYNSGVGIGLYRSSENRIMHNRANFNVRGHSEGVYNRGQDSAAILLYEQSSRNVVAYNSATHSGDGFFLWAGQTTMDTGEGGANDNVVAGNDFSYAPTNGIEATFSRNLFVNNRSQGCWHGVWGGYSWDTVFASNLFGGNEYDVAIEHGQRNSLLDNRMFGSKTAIWLWQNPTQDPNWGYPKNRDTASHDTKVEGNDIQADTTLNLSGSKRVVVRNNTIWAPRLTLKGDNSGLITSGNRFVLPADFQVEGWGAGNPIVTNPPSPELVWNPADTPAAYRKRVPAPLPGGWMPPKASFVPGARGEIRMTEWGPYDGRSPLLWPSMKPDATGGETFAILGPKGRFRVVESAGVRASAASGDVPGELNVVRDPAQPRRKLVLEYVGGTVTDMKGLVTPAGKPSTLTWSEFAPTMSWDVAFAKWDPATQDPRKVDPAPLFAEPIARMKTNRLDFAGFGKFAPGVPATFFVVRADGTFEVPDGRYVIEVTGDDGVRLDLDGKRVLNEWRYQGPTTFRTAPLRLSGRHKVRVEGFQIDGYAALRVRLIPVE